MSEYQLTTDGKGVQDLRALRADYAAGLVNSENTDGRGKGSSIIVEIRTDVPEGFAEFEAMQVRLVAGNWEDVGKRSVRNPTGQAITATAEDPFRALAHPVGKLGWVLGGGGGGGGGGADCCCTCVCVPPNMIHPGGFETVREWTFTIRNPIPWTLNDDESGEVQLASGSYTFTWDDLEGKWLCDVSSGVEYRDLNGDAQPATKTGDSTIEWISGDDYVVSLIYNAVE
jgi:hypothetical protein